MDIGGKHLIRLHGIFAGEAGGAEPTVCVFGQLHHMFGGQVAQGVGPDDLIDLVHRASGGHEQLLVGDVGAEVAGIFERRCRHHEVYLGGTGVPQQLDDAGRGGAAHDGVIHQHHPLALDGAGHDVQLDAHAVLALLLAALNEGSADVLILNEADAVGDAALLGVAQGGVQAGVRHADDHIGIHRVFLCQEPAGLLAGLVHRAALDDAVRAGKVDELEHAHLGVRAAAVILDAPQFTGLGVGDDDLAGFHVPQQGRADRIQCAALAGKDVAAAGQGADAQGPVAAGVTHCNELGGRHDHEAVSTFEDVHRLADGDLDAAHPQAVAGDEVADDLGVRGAVEDGTLVFQLTSQLNGVGQVAVVAQGHGAPAMPDDHGLSIGPHPAAGSGIPDMAGSHVGGRLCQRGQHRRGEHLVDKAEIPVADNDAVVVDGNAAALLSPVLQSEQPVVNRSSHIVSVKIIHAEDSTFFVQAIILIVFHYITHIARSSHYNHIICILLLFLIFFSNLAYYNPDNLKYQTVYVFFSSFREFI